VAPKETAAFVRPVHELKAFSKVELSAGEEKELRFLLTEKDFSSYDVAEKAFVLQPGRYRIQAAASARDVRCEAEIRVKTCPRFEHVIRL
jgi:beta-glucosidase